MGRQLKPLRARAARLSLLFALPLLAGCLEYELGSSISWSPNGGEVAFLSRGKPWIYSLTTGRLSPLSAPGTYANLAWSPDGRAIAVSSAAVVETYVGSGADFAPGSRYRVSQASAAPAAMLYWHPSGRRLLAVVFEENRSSTSEIDLATSAVRALGSGLGLYGPGGKWLLWTGWLELGRRTVFAFERQTQEGDPLPFPEASAVLLRDSEVTGILASAADNGARPLCVSAGKKNRTVSCLGPEGEAEARADLGGADGKFFSDPSRRLIAVVEEPEKEEPRLTILDSKGRPRASGKKFLSAAFEKPVVGGTAKVSRLAWSGDGNWLAWVVRDRLCLWNWRNDVVRVVAPPR